MTSLDRGPRALSGTSCLVSLCIALGAGGLGSGCGDDGGASASSAGGGGSGAATTGSTSTGGSSQGGSAGDGGGGSGGAGEGGAAAGGGGSGGAPAGCGLPVVIGRVEMEDGEEAFDVALEGTMLYVTLESDGVRAFDLSDLEAGATPRGIVDLPNAKRVVVRDSIAYVTMLGSGFAAVDFAEPDAPALRGKIASNGRTLYDVELAGERAYVVTDGLVVFDVGGDSGPVEVGLQDDGGGRALAIDGATLFAAFEIFGLNAYDLTEPDAPSLAATLDGDESLHALDVRGGVILAGGTNTGLVRIDAATPEAMAVTGVTGEASIEDVRFLREGVALAAAGDDGVLIVDVTGDVPTVLGTLVTEGSANGIAVGDSIVAIAEEGGGVLLLEACPPSP